MSIKMKRLDAKALIEESSSDEFYECWGDAVTEIDTGSGRWKKYVRIIHKHKPSGKFYAFDVAYGLTEMQEDEIFSYGDEFVELPEVEEVEIVTKQWVDKKEI